MPTAKGSKRVARQRKGLQDKNGRDQFYPRRARIDVLPDDVLLEIFDFYVDGDYRHDNDDIDGWHTLVHVCRRWRHVVFASQRRLNLRLLCTNTRPVKKLLDVWPALPIVIVVHTNRDHYWRQPKSITNIDAALEHVDRLCEITIDRIPTPLLKRFAGKKKPFTALTSLCLRSDDNAAPVIPDSFLGGSAPRLRTLILDGIPFPGLPKLLLSARDLVDLQLQLWGDRSYHYIHNYNFWYISPEAMVIALSSLTSLRSLTLELQSPRPEAIPSALTRTVLPALTSLSFKGANNYLEALISRIDAPVLNFIQITFTYQLVLHTQLWRFIDRTEAFKAPRQLAIHLYHDKVEAKLHNGMLESGITMVTVDWQLMSFANICNSLLPPLPTLERLDICEGSSFQPEDTDMEDTDMGNTDMENTQWLEFLYRFITVQDLHLDKYLAPYVALALRGLAGERVTEVLPALQNIFVEDFQSSRFVQEAIGQFVTARRLLGHPTAVGHWYRERLE